MQQQHSNQEPSPSPRCTHPFTPPGRDDASSTRSPCQGLSSLTEPSFLPLSSGLLRELRRHVVSKGDGAVLTAGQRCQVTSGTQEEPRRVAQAEQGRGLGSQGGSELPRGPRAAPASPGLRVCMASGRRAAAKAPWDPVCSLINLGFLMYCNSPSVSL